jgi:hypothetical protein
MSRPTWRAPHLAPPPQSVESASNLDGYAVIVLLLLLFKRQTNSMSWWKCFVGQLVKIRCLEILVFWLLTLCDLSLVTGISEAQNLNCHRSEDVKPCTPVEGYRRNRKYATFIAWNSFLFYDNSYFTRRRKMSFSYNFRNYTPNHKAQNLISLNETRGFMRVVPSDWSLLVLRRGYWAKPFESSTTVEKNINWMKR